MFSRSRSAGGAALAAIVSALVVAAPAAAQMAPSQGLPASVTPAQLRDVAFDQHLGQPIPLDAEFRDESGRLVHLGDYVGSRPIVLMLVYYKCTMLCSQVIHAAAGTFKALSLEPARDFEILTVSFDPREGPADARAAKADALERYQRAGAAEGWHFLTGRQASIDRLTRAAGFRYVWDGDTGQFAHPTGIMVLTPDGRFARYLFGIDYGPRDLRLALVDASEGTVGSPVDSLLLYCYHYNPASGRYTLAVIGALRVAGAATVLLLGGFIVVMVRRERRHDGKEPRG